MPDGHHFLNDLRGHIRLVFVRVCTHACVYVLYACVRMCVAYLPVSITSGGVEARRSVGSEPMGV